MYYNQFNGAQSHVLYYTSYKSVEILRTFRVNAHMTNVAAFLLVNPKLVQIRIKKKNQNIGGGHSFGRNSLGFSVTFCAKSLKQNFGTKYAS